MREQLLCFVSPFLASSPLFIDAHHLLEDISLKAGDFS